ncbi:MAG: CAAX prenyl protease-related protein [bacterium]
MPTKPDNKLSIYPPYILPYFAFLGIITLAGNFSNGLYYGTFIAYPVTAVLLWVYRDKYQEVKGARITFPDFLLALLVGLVGIVIWILPYHYIAGFTATDGIFGLVGGSRKGVDLSSLGESSKILFFLVRFVGSVVIVPIFEELFIRSFLWRYIINPDIERVTVGMYTAFAFWGSAILFALSHNEWIVALIYALLLNSFLVMKKDLRLCMIAHGISNAVLVVYVCMSGKWFLW